MERTITVANDKNRLTVSATGARSIAVLDASGQLISRASSERELAPQIFHLPAGEYQVVADGTIDDIAAEKDEQPTIGEFVQLLLTSDAKDFHVIDGIPEIPADGASFTTITIQKCGATGEPLARAGDTDEIYLRTSAGRITDAQGKQEIRSLRLRRGRAVFRLYSEDRKRVATVQAICSDPFLMNGAISVEFY